MTRIGILDGRKAVTLADMDEFMDYMVNEAGEQDGEIGVAQAMRKTAFAYRGVRLIADAIRSAPFQITRLGSDDPLDASAAYENALGFLPNPKRLNELVARSLLGPGRAYLFRVSQGTQTNELRYVRASTIKPQIDGALGLTGWERSINGQTTRYPPEQLVYFWPADDTVELGPPHTSPVTAALMAAGANYYTARYIADFFGRGAIKQTLIMVKGNPPESERERIKSWWKRFASGIRSVFETEVVNADALEPVTIGEGLEGLNNSELTLQMREDIAVALGVPMSKLLSSTVAGMGGGGVAESDDIGFYHDTVEPLGEFIADALNIQVMHPLGYQWTWLWDTLDIYQQEEKERSIAFKTYIDARMKPEIAAMMLGLEIPRPDAIPDWYADSFEDKPDPPAFGMPPRPGEDDEEEDPASSAQQAEVAKERAETVGATRAADLDKWERMAVKRFDEGHPEKALMFETDAIEPTLKAAIEGELEEAQTADDVRQVFAWVGYP